MGMWASKSSGEAQGEFQTQLSARTQWTKSVAARLQAESSATMARLRREEAAAEARVSALAARLLAPGQTVRVEGRLLGQETESAKPSYVTLKQSSVQTLTEAYLKYARHTDASI